MKLLPLDESAPLEKGAFRLFLEVLLNTILARTN